MCVFFQVTLVLIGVYLYSWQYAETIKTMAKQSYINQFKSALNHISPEVLKIGDAASGFHLRSSRP